MKVAFLGLGRMGRELVRHVIAEGHDVTVWNRTPGRADHLIGPRVAVAESAAAAVEEADLIITVLFGPDAVREVLFSGELTVKSGATVIDVTTISPADAAAFQASAVIQGFEYVHSPVIGSLEPARGKMLGVLLGGSELGVNSALLVVRLWADPQRIRIFDSASKAATSKLVANLAVAVSMQGLTEALRLGHGGGLSTEEVLAQLLDKTPLQTIAALKADTIRSETFDHTQFSVNAIAKDAGLMVRTAAKPLPALNSAYAAFLSAQDSGDGESDFSSIARNDS